MNILTGGCPTTIFSCESATSYKLQNLIYNENQKVAVILENIQKCKNLTCWRGNFLCNLKQPPSTSRRPCDMTGFFSSILPISYLKAKNWKKRKTTDMVVMIKMKMNKLFAHH